MAMTTCPECKKEISSEASNCPSCGYDFAAAKKKKKSNGCAIGCLGVIILFIFIYIIGSMSGDSSSSSTSTSSSSSTSNRTPVKAKNWSSHAYITDLEKEKGAYVASIDVRSDDKMDFPYTNTTASISIVKNKNSTWAYMEFSQAPNLVNTQIEDGYNIVEANVYIDGVRETATLTQEWGSKTLYFRYPTWLINKLNSCNTFRVNLRWYGNPNVVWSFVGDGFASEYEAMLKKFENL